MKNPSTSINLIFTIGYGRFQSQTLLTELVLASTLPIPIPIDGKTLQILAFISELGPIGSKAN
jgi:hypothetical protein